MPDFLLELFSEEIPSRMQAKGAEELLQAVLAEIAPVKPTASHLFYGARRIGLTLDGLPAQTENRTVETRGPRVGAPEAALAGFLRAAGLATVDQCDQRDTGKGIFYFAVKTEPGQAISALLAEALPKALDRLVWPKSMRWAGHDVRWVRPLHSILAILCGDGRSAEIVPARWRLDRAAGAEAAVIEAGDLTFGHRFLAPASFRVASADEYRTALADRFVLVDAVERKARILADSAKLAAGKGLRLREDPGLLDEVAGLVEWPVVRLGRIEPSFMSLPPEVLTTSMRAHQKYFALETADGTLAPWFMVVANNETPDGGARIVAGNERVLRARLSDAHFFWNQDTQRPLASRVDKLAERVFHAKLGSVRDKVERVVALSGYLARLIGADSDKAQRAAQLAKADLSTSLVGEFPELQGVMGRYLALHDGEDPDIAEAVALHYAPVGINDTVPMAPLAVTVALADKMDTLAAFFAAGEAPTGSKDPYALRRAALGVIRIVIENGLRLRLRQVIDAAMSQIPLTALANPHPGPLPQAGEGQGNSPSPALRERVPSASEAGEGQAATVLGFFADRLKFALKDQGIRHDLITAVFALDGEDDLVRLVARVKALQAFLATDDGTNLLGAYRRAAKIVGIEEKKDGTRYDQRVDPAAFIQDEEQILARRLDEIERSSRTALAAEDFAGGMTALAQLRAPVDDFFERVTVNVAQADIRANRLRLLAQIRQALDRVADFSTIEG